MVAVAVVDDDAEARLRLEDFLERFAKEQGEAAQVARFADAADLLRQYKPLYDVIFLDIEMSEVDGVSAARTIRETDANTVIVFVTNMAQMAIAGYEVEALDFIVKPIDYPSFVMVMRRALQRVRRRPRRTVKLVMREGMRMVPLERITSVEVRGHYVTYHTLDGDVEMRGTLADTEALLAEGNFMRCNRWCLVNIDAVADIDGNLITAGRETIEVSRSKRKEILHAVTLSMANTPMANTPTPGARP